MILQLAEDVGSGKRIQRSFGKTKRASDGYTRKALAIEVDTSLPGLHVVQVLERLRELHGAPAAIQVDNWTEFTSRVVDQWAFQHQVALHFIERGKPTQSAFIESFNGKFLDKCLNQNWFVDLLQAREVIETWRVDYNTVRPHRSLGYRTRDEFAAVNSLWKRRCLRHLGKRSACPTHYKRAPLKVRCRWLLQLYQPGGVPYERRQVY